MQPQPDTLVDAPKPFVIVSPPGPVGWGWWFGDQATVTWRPAEMFLLNIFATPADAMEHARSVLPAELHWLKLDQTT